MEEVDGHSMAIATVTTTYDAPKDKVWQLFADIGNVHELSSRIEASKRENQKQGTGAMRSCDFGNGRGVVEEVTVWKKGETLAFRATEFRNLPMKHMVATFRLDEVAGKTIVACAMDFEMKGGPVANLLGKPRMKKQIQSMLEGAKEKL